MHVTVCWLTPARSTLANWRPVFSPGTSAARCLAYRVALWPAVSASQPQQTEFIQSCSCFNRQDFAFFFSFLIRQHASLPPKYLVSVLVKRNDRELLSFKFSFPRRVFSLTTDGSRCTLLFIVITFRQVCCSWSATFWQESSAAVTAVWPCQWKLGTICSALGKLCRWMFTENLLMVLDPWARLLPPHLVKPKQNL